jgi:hypothetical protein
VQKFAEAIAESELLSQLSFDEALRGIASGEIRDGKTIILLQYAALNLFGTQ